MKNSIMDTKFDRRILLLNKIIIVFIVLMTLLPLLYIVVASFTLYRRSILYGS
ncbi:ABC transporter permease [Streptococcus pneumoniae]|nr:ABC transporter permease [Streptococcus pneumoniae]